MNKKSINYFNNETTTQTNLDSIDYNEDLVKYNMLIIFAIIMICVIIFIILLEISDNIFLSAAFLCCLFSYYVIYSHYNYKKYCYKFNSNCKLTQDISSGTYIGKCDEDDCTTLDDIEKAHPKNKIALHICTGIFAVLLILLIVIRIYYIKMKKKEMIKQTDLRNTFVNLNEAIQPVSSE